MIQDVLPESMRKERVLDGGGLKKVLKELSEHHPGDYGHVAHELKQIGNEAAYMSGTSFSLDDFAPNTHIRDTAMSHHQKAIDDLHRAHASDPMAQLKPAFQQKKLELYGKVEDEVAEALKHHVKNHRNNLTDWHLSGARGKAPDVRQINTFVGRQVDVTNSLVPEIALRSFSEGLSPVDYLVHAAGARKGVVATYTSVQEPGAFAKTIFAASADMVVSSADCGTHRGKTIGLAGPGANDALDRFLCEDVSGVARRNDLITSSVLEAARKHGAKEILVRSPIYCAQPEGLCAMCFGLSESGRVPHIGEHVGIKSAQALSEPLTQLALNNKHAGGTVAKKSPFATIDQFMNARQVESGTAALSKLSGTVTRIEPKEGIGHNVWVKGDHGEEIRHYLHKSVNPLEHLTVGSRVHRGQALSDGQASPREMVEYLGIEKGREYFANQTKSLYADNGINGHGKVFETVSRALVGLARVHHAGDSHDLVPGDIVRWNAVGHMMAAPKIETIPLAKATGRILSNSIGTVGTFTTLTKNEIRKIQRFHGPDHPVSVFHHDQPVIEPMMLGAEGAALHKGDWMANLAFSRTKSQFIKENVPTFATADLHSFNPLPSYAFGAEFGKGEGGRY